MISEIIDQKISLFDFAKRNAVHIYKINGQETESIFLKSNWFLFNPFHVTIPSETC